MIYMTNDTKEDITKEEEIANILNNASEDMFMVQIKYEDGKDWLMNSFVPQTATEALTRYEALKEYTQTGTRIRLVKVSRYMPDGASLPAIVSTVKSFTRK